MKRPKRLRFASSLSTCPSCGASIATPRPFFDLPSTDGVSKKEIPHTKVFLVPLYAVLFHVEAMRSCSSSLQTCKAHTCARNGGFQIALLRRNGNLQHRCTKTSSATNGWMLCMKDSHAMCGRSNRVCSENGTRVHSVLEKE